MKLSYEIEIECTPERIWYWLGDPERAKAWQNNVSETRILQRTPDMVGTTFVETIEENGESTDMQGVVTSYIENRSLGMHLNGRYNSVDVDWQIEEAGRRSRLTVHADVRFKGRIKVASILMRSAFRENLTIEFEEEFARLKKLCESREENS